MTTRGENRASPKLKMVPAKPEFLKKRTSGPFAGPCLPGPWPPWHHSQVWAASGQWCCFYQIRWASHSSLVWQMAPDILNPILFLEKLYSKSRSCKKLSSPSNICYLSRACCYVEYKSVPHMLNADILIWGAGLAQTLNSGMWENWSHLQYTFGLPPRWVHHQSSFPHL